MRGLITGDGEDKLLGILSKYTHRGVKRTMSLGNYGVGCWGDKWMRMFIIICSLLENSWLNRSLSSDKMVGMLVFRTECHWNI